MSDPRFLQKGMNAQLAHVVEECGEVLAAAGKSQRWGFVSVNPLLPGCEQEYNIVWLMRELRDLREAIKRFETTAREQFPGMDFEP